MPRSARIVFAGVPHHVTQRGNRRGRVFFSTEDCEFYLKWLCHYADRHSVDVLAYCLMTNHVHLVAVPSTEHGLHKALKPLHTRFAQRVNQAKKWKGHVWQGRFFSSALDATYLWTTIRYVERNPVRARMANRAEDYPWSSAAAHCGLRVDPVLTTKATWQRELKNIDDWSTWLSAGDEQQELAKLRAYTKRGLPCGSPSFIEILEKRAGRPLRYRSRGRPRASDAKKG